MISLAVAGLVLLPSTTTSLSPQVGSYEPGLTLRLYLVSQNMEELPTLVNNQTPNVDRLIDKLDIPNGNFEFKDQFYAEVTGEFFAAKAGEYSFRLTSDDGSELFVDGKSLLSMDGVHAAKSEVVKVQLTAGWHKLRVRYFENTGGEELKLEWTRNGADFEVMGGESTRVQANITRVVSPGTKAVMGIGPAMKPGSGLPLETIHPGWEVVKIRPDDFKPQVGALAFLSNGSLLVSNFKPNQSGQFLPDLADGKLYRVDGVTGPNPKPVVTEVATDLQEPLGLCVLPGKDGKDRVFLAQRKEITEIIDADGDGKYEKRKTVGSGWIADNYHHFTFGMAHKDGKLYAALSTSITFNAPGINGPNPAFRGCTFAIDPDKYRPEAPLANIEFLTGGHRTPNGVSNGPWGLILVGENQGSWQPTNKLNVIQPGSFFGHYNNTTFKTKEYPEGGVPGPYDYSPLAPPALHLPQGECANSPGQTVAIPSGPYKDQVLISDVKYGGLRRAWLENVRGVWQGGVVQYSQGFEVGTNRLVWGPDGDLYIGGIGASESWAWTDPKTGQWTTYGLQKIRQTGKPVFEIDSVKIQQDGFRVTFSEPLKNGLKKDDLFVRSWNYQPTVEYGGDKKNRETLEVQSVTRIGSDNRSFLVKLKGLKEDRVLHWRITAESKSGRPLWAGDVFYTLNKLPNIGLAQKLKTRVLVFSKTAAFRHDSIPTGVAALKTMAALNGWEVDATEDSSVFTAENLKKYQTVVFLSTTGDILNPAQEQAFEAFVKNGGGFVGIHAAADTEYDCAFYGEVVGGYFKSHPAIQQATVKVEDHKHPTTSFLPAYWPRFDEWYNYRANPRNGAKVLASLDESTYKGGDMGDHPIMWYKTVGKGRSWYTGGGHTKESYSEILFLKTIEEAIRWTSQTAPR